MSATPESVAATSPAEIAVTESQVPSAPLPGATILGYPRIGRDRELKRAVESFWKGNLSVDELKHAAAELRGATRSRLMDLGLTQPASVPADFTLYARYVQVDRQPWGPRRPASRDPAQCRWSLSTSRAISRWPAVRAPVRPWR